MSIAKVNRCVDCGVEPCLGKNCTNQNHVEKRCDICGDETKILLKYGNTEYCSECLIEALLIDEIITEVEYDDVI